MEKWYRRIPFLLLFVLMPAFAQTPAQPTEPSPILIVEVQTGSSTSATEEFVELFNQTDEPYPADELKLQYRSATGSDWLTKVQLDGVMEPRGRYLIATEHLADTANVVTSLGLASAGGHLRVVALETDGESEFDQMAWGTAQFALISPAQTPAGGQSLKRHLDEDGRFVDSGNDAEDFTISSTPSPESTTPAIEDEESPDPVSGPGGSTGNPGTNQSPTSDQQSENLKRNYPRLELSELFIDPDKPLTDADDEFVELYNPNAEAVDLEGYIIQTGAKYSYSFTLPNITIKPKQFLAFFSLDTGLALSNSGGGARLLAPNKAPMYEVPPYEKAKPDTAWANIGGVWQWSAKPTPNAPNVAASTSAAGRNASGGSSGRTYLNQGRTLGASDDSRNIYDEPPALADNQIDTAVVAGVGAMALLYAGNEYRYDIGNFFHKLKKHLAARRGGRQAA